MNPPTFSNMSEFGSVCDEVRAYVVYVTDDELHTLDCDSSCISLSSQVLAMAAQRTTDREALSDVYPITFAGYILSPNSSPEFL